MSAVKKDKLTPMMKQYFDIKEKYPDGILFFRMGDFYEMFLEDAEKAAGPLEIALTKRGGMSMCGVPYHSKDNYIPKLLKAGYKIVICDQLEDPKLAKGIVKRGVTEIITPGTVTDSKLITTETNYLTSFIYNGSELAIASADISTGSFILFLENVSDIKSTLRDEIARINPKELLVMEAYKDDALIGNIIEGADKSYSVSYYNDIYFDKSLSEKILKDHFKVSNLKGFGIEEQPLLICVAGVVIRYLRQTQLKDISHINTLEIITPSDYLQINETSIRHLELIESMNFKNSKTTLFHIINNTITSMGERLLKTSIVRPLIDKDCINSRLQKVDILYDDTELNEKVRNLLKQIPDLDRLIARLSLKKILPREVVSLKEGLIHSQAVKEALVEYKDFYELSNRIDSFSGMISRIDDTVLDECKNDFDAGEVIKPTYSKELEEYIDITKNGKQHILKIEAEEKEKTGINNLKIAYNKVLGYYVQVSKGQSKKVPEYYIKRQSLTNSERYTLERLNELEVKILNANEKLIELQKKYYDELIEELLTHIEVIKSASKSIAEIDMYTSFAYTAKKNKYTKPNISTTKEIKILSGRHPVVERMIDEYTFVANDLCMNDKDSKLLIVTGPNMAGKSTYLRQNALIVIMAQMGCYVPAEEAHIGIVDKIFTRIGASDNLAKGESTFLVEMTEAANILNNMTSRSLIIMDEIGRGTSTYDGLSIAWSIIEYLTDKKIRNGKTLFATHYHELTSLSKEKGISNLQVLVREWEDEIVFLHKVEQGASSKSYGIQVARLAGIPLEIIERSKEILDELEEISSENQKKMLKPDRLKHPIIDEDGQLSLFQITTKMDPIRKKILKTDIDNLSHDKLEKWAKKLKQMAENQL